MEVRFYNYNAVRRDANAYNRVEWRMKIAILLLLFLSSCATTSLLDLGYDRTTINECGEFKEYTWGPRNPWAFVAIVPCYPIALAFDVVTFPIQWALVRK